MNLNKFIITGYYYKTNVLSNTGFLGPQSSSSLRKQPAFLGNLLLPTRSTTQIWVVTRHQCRVSAHVPQRSFRGETSGVVAKCRLFSQATTKKCYGTFAEYDKKSQNKRSLAFGRPRGKS